MAKSLLVNIPQLFASCLARPACRARQAAAASAGECLIAERAVRPALVVIGAPCPDDLSGFGERSEPVLVKALVVELAVEALHVCVLRRLAGLYQPQRHTVAVGPAVEPIACELRILVGPDYLRQAADLP